MTLLQNRAVDFRKDGQAQGDFIQTLVEAINGGLDLPENVRWKTLSYTTNATPDTEDTKDVTALGLKATPTRWIVVRANKGGVLYESSYGSWSATSVRFKCTVASMAVVVAFA